MPPWPAPTRNATASTSSDAAIVTASARRDLGGEEEEEKALALLFLKAARVRAGAGGDRTARAGEWWGPEGGRSRASVRARCEPDFCFFSYLPQQS
jgi:hypothetical protein